MAGIGVIANPNSRHNRRNPRLIQRLAYVVGDRGTLATTHDLDDVYRVAEDFKARGIDILCLNGGDGTNHVTLTAFIKVYGDAPLPRIALLRGGTMNTIAADCGISGSPAQILFNILDKYHNGLPFETVQRTAMHVGDGYGFLFGNGIISNFLEVYYEGGNASPTKAMTTLTKAIGSAMVRGPLIQRIFSRVEVKVEVDGEVWPYEAWDSIAVGTVAHIGLSFKPFFKSLEQPGRVHILGIACGAARTIRQLPNFYRAHQVSDPEILDAAAQRIVLTASRPFGYTLDGDMYTCDEQLVIEPGPQISIIRG